MSLHVTTCEKVNHALTSRLSLRFDENFHCEVSPVTTMLKSKNLAPLVGWLYIFHAEERRDGPPWETAADTGCASRFVNQSTAPFALVTQVALGSVCSDPCEAVFIYHLTKHTSRSLRVLPHRLSPFRRLSTIGERLTEGEWSKALGYGHPDSASRQDFYRGMRRRSERDDLHESFEGGEVGRVAGVQRQAVGGRGSGDE